MKIKSLVIGLLCIVMIAAVPVMADDEQQDAVHIRALLASAAPSTVIVKAVVEAQINQGGQTQKHDGRAELSGIVVDPSGLVMVGNGAFKPNGGGDTTDESNNGVTFNASDYQVVIPPDPTEHPATLVATDSELGVEFLKITDLGAKTLPAIDFSAGDPVQIGIDVLQVNRIEKGYDYAPFISVGVVIGDINKPRHAYILAGGANTEGLPCFDSAGKPIGLPIRINATQIDEAPGFVVGNHMFGETNSNAQSGIFLIPAKNVATVIAEAVARAAQLPAAPTGDTGAPSPSTTTAAPTK